MKHFQQKYICTTIFLYYVYLNMCGKKLQNTRRINIYIHVFDTIALI